MQNLLFSTGMTLTAYIDFLNSSKDEAYLYALLSLIRLSKAIQSQSYQSKKKKEKAVLFSFFFLLFFIVCHRCSFSCLPDLLHNSLVCL